MVKGNRFKNSFGLMTLCMFLLLCSHQVFAGSGNMGGAEGSVLGIIAIDVESDMELQFNGNNSGKAINIIHVRDVDGKNKNVRAGLLRITGASVETVVNIEREKLWGKDKNNNDIFTVYDFNLYEGGAGSSVTVMPLASEESYEIGIGVTVEGKPNQKETYQGINIININYL